MQKLFKHNITMLQSINHCQKPRQRTMGLKCHPKEYKLINMIFKYIDKSNKHTHIRSRDHWWCWMDRQKDSLIIKWPKLYSILENISIYLIHTHLYIWIQCIVFVFVQQRYCSCALSRWRGVGVRIIDLGVYSVIIIFFFFFFILSCWLLSWWRFR